ncbi:hypothetical protein C8A03DRAFT_32840 [Achaetomium macrosporum]|uniref:Histone-lysine N-methyltransferase ASH1L n=1 Tax=Achaetomium macrosporum TaxID=79813 RepID=A0AAN7CCN5_9PEZI|nr:hypothetical protein C8A03DRAFT_32840 [Achaetomium macrosporum]
MAAIEAAIETAPTMVELDSPVCGSSFPSTIPSDDMSSSSNSASMSSTPPTTVSPDSMSIASEPDALNKPESVAASSIEAIVPVPQSHGGEQPESGQQTPIGHDAIVVAEQPLATEPASAARPRRARSSLPTYNIAKLLDTNGLGRRRSKGNAGERGKRRAISDAMMADRDDGSAKDSIDAAAKTVRVVTRRKSDASAVNRPATRVSTPRSARISKLSSSSPAPAHLTRRATRLSGAPVETLSTKLSALSKRGKKAVDKALGGLSRELKRLQDTNEYARIDTRPVRYTVWSNGKYVEVDPAQATTSTAPEPPRKKVRVDEDDVRKEQSAQPEKEDSVAPAFKKPRVKKWLEKGLYAGQEAPLDIFKGLTAQEKKKLASLPELLPSGKPNKTFPAPMYNGLRMLIHGRDFKLPFDVCNPLPPGQPKPAAYRTMTKNRFVGNAAAYWKKTPHFEDFASKCVCKPEDGCGESCQNRIMLYECDETNCNIGKAHCTNRAFQDLQERTKKGGRYRVGVEVFKTADRGYGVRSNRCFEPNQIIMEYTGEIITEEECERRMNEVYKDNECYYLMSFDQNMIIDATTGSIARFVNHSCSPNCRMIKWIVSGQPRMALFAGDRPIMTGEELTYDYNFDPFSAKNVQKCLCGSPNCRGVLGPKPKEVKQPKSPKEDKKAVKTPSKASARGSAKGSAKSSAKAAAKASAKPTAKTTDKAPTKISTKRKLQDAFDFDGDEREGATTVKKRKIVVANGLNRTVSSVNLKAAKGAAKRAASTIVRGVSSISVAAKKKTVTETTIATTTRRASAGGVTKTTLGKKTTTTKTKIVIPSRSPSLTIVAAGIGSSSTSSTPGTQKTEKPITPASSSSAKKSTVPKLTISSGKTSPRKWTPSRKAIEAGLVALKSPSSSTAVKAVATTKTSSGKGLHLKQTKIKLVSASKSSK